MRKKIILTFLLSICLFNANVFSGNTSSSTPKKETYRQRFFHIMEKNKEPENRYRIYNQRKFMDYLNKSSETIELIKKTLSILDIIDANKVNSNNINTINENLKQIINKYQTESGKQCLKYICNPFYDIIDLLETAHEPIVRNVLYQNLQRLFDKKRDPRNPLKKPPISKP